MTELDVAVPLLAGVIGAQIGSFLNVVIHRVPRQESVVRPPSQCPSCHTTLRNRDLVPVASWLVLRGRCRSCSAPISSRYPMVELLTAVLFALVAWSIGWSWALPAYLALVAFLVALSGIDLDTNTLPRRIVYAAGLTGMVLLTVASFAIGEPRRLWWAAVGGLGVLGVFWLLFTVAKGGFGFGDVRLGAALGWYLGWLGLTFVPVGIFAGFVLGSIVGVALMVLHRADRRTAVPFGPFLAAGALLVVVIGRPLVDLAWPA